MSDLGLISKYGYKNIFIFGVLFFLAFIFSFCVYFFALLFLAILFVYRNPERIETFDDQKAIYSPIDGKIDDISLVSTKDKELLKISIINRIYDAGQIRLPIFSTCDKISFKNGLSLCLYMKNSDLLNKKVIYDLSNAFISYKMIVIGGVFSRKIYYESFQSLKANRRIGFFTDGKVILYLPKNIRLNIARGNSIKSCEPIGFIN